MIICYTVEIWHVTDVIFCDGWMEKVTQLEVGAPPHLKRTQTALMKEIIRTSRGFTYWTSTGALSWTYWGDGR